uniref:Histone 2A-domain-containing protein n=1 Tax=Pithovirus LCPAC001 TaxID=2506585 RepID=A0A481Z1R0_9VIRU|nr:MAG: histone 2A-domain-containing protein [Pithovirus LCPAC001]
MNFILRLIDKKSLSILYLKMSKNSQNSLFPNYTLYISKILKLVICSGSMKKESNEQMNKIVDIIATNIVKGAYESTLSLKKKILSEEELRTSLKIIFSKETATSIIKFSETILVKLDDFSAENKIKRISLPKTLEVFYPIKMLKNILLKLGKKNIKMSLNADLYFITFMFYITHLILELSYNEASIWKRTRLGPRDILIGINGDEEFRALFNKLDIYIDTKHYKYPYKG